MKRDRRLGDSPEKCHKELDEIHDAVVLGERNLSGGEEEKRQLLKQKYMYMFKLTD